MRPFNVLASERGCWEGGSKNIFGLFRICVCVLHNFVRTDINIENLYNVDI